MKRNSLLILSAVVVLMAACGKKGGRSGLLVPKDATIVVHINSASLSSKLSWEEIKQTNWFKEMSKEASDTLARQLLADPASSGINTKADLVFYMKKQGKGGYLVFEGSLTDAAAYEKMLQKMNKEAKEIKKDGEFSSLVTGESGVVVWNKSMFAVVANANVPDMAAGMRGNKWSEKYEFLNDSLRIFGQQALTLKSSDNLDTDSRFADLVKDGSDMHLWMNLAGYYGNLGSMMEMMKVNLLLEDNVSAVSVNFDNGKISAKQKQYYGDEMTKFLSNNKPEPISADVINRIPSSNVAGVIAFNYPPKGLQGFLKLIGVDGMANGYLSQLNYSIEEFVKANKGEVLLAVTDLSIVNKKDTINYGNGSEPYIYNSSKPDMKVLFAASVNDKAAFEKLITLAWESTKDMKEGIPEISYKLENNWFAASNSAEHTDKFLAGGNSKLPFVDKVAGHPLAMYIDINKILRTANGSVEDSSANAMMDVSLRMWQDIVASGGEYKDKAIEFSFEINLMDKNTNSLKQLNQYFDQLSVIDKEKRKKYADVYAPAEVVPAETAPAEK